MGQQNALSLQQSKFIIEYLKNGENATQAAITAGYSEKTATEQGSRLLTLVQVSQEIERRKEDIAAMLLVTPQRLARELARIAFHDTKDFFDADGNLKPFIKLPEDLTRSVGGFEVDKSGKVKKVRLSDKQRAIETIAKLTGMIKPDSTTTNVQVVVLPPKESPTIIDAPALPQPEWE